MAGAAGVGTDILSSAEVIRVDGGWDFGFGSRMRAE